MARDIEVARLPQVSSVDYPKKYNLPPSVELIRRDFGSCRQLTLPYLLNICVQLTSGLRHLHSCGILHRDLKSDNALVASKDPLIVKWADFGCSVKLVPSTADRVTYGKGVGLCGLV